MVISQSLILLPSFVRRKPIF